MGREVFIGCTFIGENFCQGGTRTLRSSVTREECVLPHSSTGSPSHTWYLPVRPNIPDCVTARWPVSLKAERVLTFYCISSIKEERVSVSGGVGGIKRRLSRTFLFVMFDIICLAAHAESGFSLQHSRCFMVSTEPNKANSFRQHDPTTNQDVCHSASRTAA